MRIVVPCTPKGKWDHRRDPVIRWFLVNDTTLLLDGFTTEMFICDGWDEVEALLKKEWQKGEDFIWVEHDVEPNLDVLRFIRDCPVAPICTVPFEWHIENGRVAGGSCSVGACMATPSVVINDHFNPRLVRYPEEWATESGLGCIRFRGEFTRRMDWGHLPAGSRNIDGRLWMMLRKKNVSRQHVHWPEGNNHLLKHYHVKCIGDV